MIMDFSKIADWILQHPVQYPGIHQSPQPRSDKQLQPIDPKSQFLVTFSATSDFIKQKLQEGKGINWQGLGAFSFEVFSDVETPTAHPNLNIDKVYESQKQNRKTFHRLRPCFIPDQSLMALLPRFQEKDEVGAANSQHSIYQKGFQMVFCNPVPIASQCALGKELVKSILQSFIQAVKDLIVLGKPLVLDFGFIQISIINKKLEYIHPVDFVYHLNDMSFEEKTMKSNKETKGFWNQKKEEAFNQSNLSSVVNYPLAVRLQGDINKTIQLQKASKDLNSITKSEQKFY